jgi:hypothetical protein
MCIVRWATLPTTSPRSGGRGIMIDCISGRREIAARQPDGHQLAYGITPMEHRGRYREAFALVLSVAGEGVRVEREVLPARRVNLG